MTTAHATCTAELRDDEFPAESHACTLGPHHDLDLHQCDCGEVWS